MDHIGQLRPDERNARRHTVRNLATIEAALREVGAARSIVVDEDGVILAGNATVDAAAAVGITRLRVIDADGEEIVAVRRSGLTPEQKRRLALFDNRAAELAEWDPEQLAALAEETDLSDIFRDDELEDLLAGAAEDAPGLTDPDAVPEPPVEPVTKLGDLYRLGDHRLLCGDATVATDVERLVGTDRPVVMWTDPPYGVSYVGKTKDALVLRNDDADGLALLLHDAFANATAVLAEGAAFYVARPPGALSVIFGTTILGLGWRLHEELQWVKDSLVLGHSDYHLKHETIVFGYVPGGGRRGRGGDGWYGDNSQVSVFEVARPKSSPDHPTGKPVDLVAAHVSNSSRRGDQVLDLFGGSGSTLIACERTDRACRIMEIDPTYCDVVVRRWEAFTGKAADLVPLGEAA